jgi:hypothetical protein
VLVRGLSELVVIPSTALTVAVAACAIVNYFDGGGTVYGPNAKILDAAEGAHDTYARGKHADPIWWAWRSRLRREP